MCLHKIIKYFRKRKIEMEFHHSNTGFNYVMSMNLELSPKSCGLLVIIWTKTTCKSSLKKCPIVHLLVLYMYFQFQFIRKISPQPRLRCIFSFLSAICCNILEPGV